MKKKIIAIFCSALLLIGLVGCSSNNETSKNQNNTNSLESTKSKLDEFKEKLKENGFEVGENEAIAYDMVGANNGYKFKVDGELVEIYEYDKDNLSEEGKNKVQEAQNGSISFSGVNIPVKYNNYLVLARMDEHSNANEIIEVFNSL